MSAAKRIGIAIVEHSGRILVGVRGPDVPLAGCAEFPGGKCEPSETPTACAVRECREETGLAVLPVRLLQEKEFQYPHGAVQLHFILCQPVTAAEVRDQHGNFRWVLRDQLQSLPFPEANREVLELISRAS